MTNFCPLFSVIIPCYNSGDFIREAVKSVWEQTNTGFTVEVLIVDDSSNDCATIQALQDIQLSNKAKVYHNSGQRGPGAARNFGLQHAKGDWIAFLDADDFYTSNSFSSRLEVLKRFPDASWIGGDIAFCDQEGLITEPSYFSVRDRAFYYLRESFSTRQPVNFDNPLLVFLDTPLLNTNSSIIRADVLRKIGQFDPRFRLQQDIHLFLRLARHLPFVFTPNVVAINRQHANNSTQNTIRMLRWRHAALSQLSKEDGFVGNVMLRTKIQHVAYELFYENVKHGYYLHAFKWRLFAGLKLRSGLPCN